MTRRGGAVLPERLGAGSRRPGAWRVVDFNNDSTVSTPPGDVVKIVVLERREQCIEALESYHNVQAANLETGHKLSILRARVMAFWYQVQAMAKRRLSEEKYEEIRADFENATREKELVSGFEWLNEFVDDLGLTFIDSRAKYDRTHVEDSNSKKGL